MQQERLLFCHHPHLHLPRPWFGSRQVIFSPCTQQRHRRAACRRSRRAVVTGAQLSADDEDSASGDYSGLTPTVPPKTLLRIHAKPPVCTYVLIGLNVSVLLFQNLSQRILRVIPNLSMPFDLQVVGAKVSTKIVAGQVWRLVTAAFLHVSWRHLFFNSYALYALGSAAEILYGRAAFLSIYLSGAIGGNLASLLASTTSSRPSVGSSGAVFSLIAAMCVHLERNRGPIGPAARENLRLVAVATALNLAGGWLMPSVDGWAHFGGCLFGILMGIRLVPKVILHRSTESGVVTYVEVRRKGKRAALIAGVVAAAVAVLVTVVLGLHAGSWNSVMLLPTMCRHITPQV